MITVTKSHNMARGQRPPYCVADGISPCSVARHSTQGEDHRSPRLAADTVFLFGTGTATPVKHQRGLQFFMGDYSPTAAGVRVLEQSNVPRPSDTPGERVNPGLA